MWPHDSRRNVTPAAMHRAHTQPPSGSGCRTIDLRTDFPHVTHRGNGGREPFSLRDGTPAYLLRSVTFARFEFPLWDFS
jgi:hypothetical protein